MWPGTNPSWRRWGGSARFKKLKVKMVRKIILEKKKQLSFFTSKFIVSASKFNHHPLGAAVRSLGAFCCCRIL